MQGSDDQRDQYGHDPEEDGLEDGDEPDDGGADQTQTQHLEYYAMINEDYARNVEQLQAAQNFTGLYDDGANLPPGGKMMAEAQSHDSDAQFEYDDQYQATA